MKCFNKGILLPLSAVLLISCGIGGNHESDFESLGVDPDNSTGTSGKSKGEEVILDYDHPGEVDKATFDSAFTKFFASNASFRIDADYNSSYASSDQSSADKHYVRHMNQNFLAKVDFNNNIAYGLAGNYYGYAYYGKSVVFAYCSYGYSYVFRNSNHETIAQAMQNGTFISESYDDWKFAFPSVYSDFTYDAQTSFYYTTYKQYSSSSSNPEVSFGVQISGGRIVRVFYESASGYYKLTNVGITELYVPSEAKDQDEMMHIWEDDYPVTTSSRS